MVWLEQERKNIFGLGKIMSHGLLMNIAKILILEISTVNIWR